MEIQLLRPAELAQMVGMAKQTVYNRIATNGDLPPVIRMGRMPRFHRRDVEIWIEAKRTALPPLPSVKRRLGRPTKAEQVGRRKEMERRELFARTAENSEA